MRVTVEIMKVEIFILNTSNVKAELRLLTNTELQLVMVMLIKWW